MKQMIILEVHDLDRLKAGEALELTNNLLLSLLVRRKGRPATESVDSSGLSESEQAKKERKRLYGIEYRKRRAKERGREKPRRATMPVPCKLGCGKLLGSAQAFGGHKAHCPNRRKS